MNWRDEGDKLIIILERGEEIVASLQTFARENRVKGGFFFGLGAVRDCTLGYYDVAVGKYMRKKISEGREIVSLIGDISLIEGKHFAHCHIQLTDAEMNVKGGHLFEGYISATCEIMLFPTAKTLERKEIPGEELKMIRL